MSMVWPGLTNGRQHRMHRHRRHVLELRRDVGRHRDAQLRQHVVERLDGEGRLAGLIAGAVEAHDQSVAHELVGAHALYLRQVLDAFRVRKRRASPARNERQPEHNSDGDSCAHDQYGANTELKNRASQPMRLELLITPFPE